MVTVTLLPKHIYLHISAKMNELFTLANLCYDR